MSKATEMAKVSVKGGFHLLWGLVASTLISAVGTITIAGLLGADNYGLYSIALTAPNLISTFRDWGVATAMIKYSAQYNSEKDYNKVKNVFFSGLVFEVTLGAALSLLCFALSPFIAGTLFHRPAIAPLIEILSLFILTGGLVNTATAAFTGMETMHLNSIMLIVQSIAKTGFIVGLVVIGLGTIGAATGFTIAVMIAGVTGLLLMWTMYKSLPKASGKLELVNTIKVMFNYGLPVSIGTILLSFVTQFYSTILAIYVTDNAIIGNYNLAVLFSVLITFFAVPVTTMMFPAFSKLDPQKDKETLKNVFQYSVKYAALIIVPVSAMVMALAQPGIGTIFGNTYTQAPLFLALLSVNYIYSAFGSLSASNLLNGQGYTAYNMKLSILTAVLGFPISFLLISNYGVIGLIITTLTVSLPSLFISLRFIKNKFDVSLDWLSSAKILFSSAVAGILTYIIISEIAFANIINLVIGILVFCFIFFTAALFSGTVKKADLANMKEITNSLGPLRKPLRSILSLLEKISTTFHLK